MKNKTKIPIIFFLIIVCALPFALNINTTPSSLPTTVLSIACTILLASLAIPSLLGISESKIFKRLFVILYRFIHILFPIYQVVLAVTAIIAEYSEVGSIIACIIAPLLPVLIILDLLYILFYLYYFFFMVGSPLKMLKIFEKLILKKIRKKMKKGSEKDIHFIIKKMLEILEDTSMGEEKSKALNIFGKLLTEVTSFYPRGAGIIPTESQYGWWNLLVENVYEMCYSDDHLYSANDRNLSEAVDILDKAWQSINHWSKSGFDYAVCPRTLKRLADWGIKKGYDRSVDKAVAVLKKIWEQCLADQETPRTSPFEIASDMARIGISAVKEGKENITAQFIEYLFYFYKSSKEEKYLFYNLKLMSFIWDNNRDALEYLGKKLIGTDESKIDEAVKYGSDCFPIETVRIRRFLDAVDKFRKKDG